MFANSFQLQNAHMAPGTDVFLDRCYGFSPTSCVNSLTSGTADAKSTLFPGAPGWFTRQGSIWPASKACELFEEWNDEELRAIWSEVADTLLQDVLHQNVGHLSLITVRKEDDLAKGYSGLPRLHEAVMAHSHIWWHNLMHIALGHGFADDLQGYIRMWNCLFRTNLCGSPHGSAWKLFQHISFDTPSMSTQTKRLSERLSIAYMSHLSLTPCERRERSLPRTIAFDDVLLRTSFPHAGIWAYSAECRPRSITIWIFGARDCEEGMLVRGGHFEDVAGLLSDTESVDLHLFGNVEPFGLPCGKLVQVSTHPQHQGGVPNGRSPDLVIFAHAGLDYHTMLQMQEITGMESSPTNGSKFHKTEAPVFIFTSRCEAEAYSVDSTLQAHKTPALFGPIRNLFSGAAADINLRFDDHGWIVAARGVKLQGVVPRSPLSDKAILTHSSPTLAEQDAVQHLDGHHWHRGTPAFWGILDLKFDPNSEIKDRVKVLEAGEGNTSRFSGFGARVKEAFISEYKQVQDKLNRTLLIENKRVFHDSVTKHGYEHILPRQGIWAREYTSTLPQDIIDGLQLQPGSTCMLKLCNRCRGAGCIPVGVCDLPDTLKRVLEPPPEINASPMLAEGLSSHPSCMSLDEHCQHWWSNECPYFIAEECCSSIPISKQGLAYDGTMRVSFSLHRDHTCYDQRFQMDTDNLRILRRSYIDFDDDEVQQLRAQIVSSLWLSARRFDTWSNPAPKKEKFLHIQWHGGYWKLPEKDTDSDDLRGRIISKASQGTRPVRRSHLLEVFSALGDCFEQVFGAPELSFSEVLKRYEQFPVFASFTVARLSYVPQSSNPARVDHLLNQAKQKLTESVGRPRSVVEAYILRLQGVSEMLAGKLKTAAGIFEEALRIMPTNATAMYLLGMCQLDLGEWNEAIALMRRSLALDPDFKSPYVNIGFGCIKLQMWDEAIRMSREGLDRHCTMAHLHYNMGMGYYMQAAGAETDAGIGNAWDTRHQALTALCSARDQLRLNRREGVQRGLQPMKPSRKHTSSLWTKADDTRVAALEDPAAKLMLPRCCSGWKFYGFRP